MTSRVGGQRGKSDTISLVTWYLWLLAAKFSPVMEEGLDGGGGGILETNNLLDRNREPESLFSV